MTWTRAIQNDKNFLELTATSSPVREADLSELQRRLNEAMIEIVLMNTEPW